MVLASMVLLVVILTIVSIRDIKARGKILNHIMAFSFGMIMYMIIPIIIGEMKLFYNHKSLAIYYDVYSSISTVDKMLYILFLYILVLSYYLGSKCSIVKRNGMIDSNESKFKLIRNIKLKYNFSLDENKLMIITALFTFLMYLYILLNFKFFFKGYTVGYNQFLNRGTFAALNFTYLGLTLVFDAYTNAKCWKVYRIIIFTSLFAFNVALFSMGTRMYFITTALVLLTYFEFKYDYFKQIWLFLSVIGLLLLSAALMGAIRFGLAAFNIEHFTLNIVLEPLYTSLSMLAFLRDGVRDIINFPIVLLSSFINLVPTIILKNKLSFIVDPKDLGFNIYSPQGAQSLYVGLMINFGWIGSIIVMFFASNFLKMLYEHTKKVKIIQIIYSSIVGVLIFSFFRDGLVTSFVKSIIQFSIVMPLMFYLISLKITKRRVDDESTID